MATVRSSKAMTRLLRHAALEEGLKMDKDGWVAIEDLLRHRSLNRLSREDVKTIVATCPKQRFQLDEAHSRIRASQGHSIELRPDDLLQPVTDPLQFPVVVHGTKRKLWPAIKDQGLCRMSRTHIHFATALPDADNVISGMRSSSNVLIYLDVAKLLEAGIPLYVSANHVVLSPGLDGYIAPEYFKRIDFK
jgi:RNA:NAD 2'-phosphotransferase (TPT1/KptA family)